MQNDCKNYFGFLVEEFSLLFDCWALCLLETVTGSVATQEFRERGILVYTSSENVSTTNAKKLLESHCFPCSLQNFLRTL